MFGPYRRKWGSSVWHFCWECPEWPVFRYEERFQRPESGEICCECRRIAACTGDGYEAVSRRSFGDRKV